MRDILRLVDTEIIIEKLAANAFKLATGRSRNNNSNEADANSAKNLDKSAKRKEKLNSLNNILYSSYD